MDVCTCPVRGYCERRAAHINPIHYAQCQAGKVAKVDAVYERIAEARDNREIKQQRVIANNPAREARAARAKASVERTKRLIGWLTLLRHPQDTGIGDTAHRLCMRACRAPDASAALQRLLKQCSCSRVDAIARLNTEHPYCHTTA